MLGFTYLLLDLIALVHQLRLLGKCLFNLSLQLGVLIIYIIIQLANVINLDFDSANNILQAILRVVLRLCKATNL